ncbi:MAG: hypothetical protein AB7V77_04755 [Candidatus Woesearchaeota archaeon]
MNYLNEFEFEREKARLLKTYNCKTLKEVIAFLENQIKLQNEKKSEKKKKIQDHSP